MEQIYSEYLNHKVAKKIRELKNSPAPYIFIFQKDNPNFAISEILASDLNSKIEVSTVINGVSPSGHLTSPPIGPSKSWNALSWQVSELESHDQVSIDLWGVNENNEEILLHENIQAYDTSLAHIDAQQYPYLKMRWNSQDTVNRTSPQLDYWRIFYDSYPEAALAPNINFTFQADTLQQGEPLHLEIAVENVSETDMDSLLIKYTITDSKNTEQKSRIRMEPLRKGKKPYSHF